LKLKKISTWIGIYNFSNIFFSFGTPLKAFLQNSSYYTGCFWKAGVLWVEKWGNIFLISKKIHIYLSIPTIGIYIYF